MAWHQPFELFEFGPKHIDSTTIILEYELDGESCGGGPMTIVHCFLAKDLRGLQLACKQLLCHQFECDWLDKDAFVEELVEDGEIPGVTSDDLLQAGSADTDTIMEAWLAGLDQKWAPLLLRGSEAQGGDGFDEAAHLAACYRFGDVSYCGTLEMYFEERFDEYVEWIVDQERVRELAKVDWKRHRGLLVEYLESLNQP